MATYQVNGFAMNADVVPGVLPMDTVFMHGNLASNRWWQPSLEIWKQQAHPGLEGRAIMAEWRGCGKSAAPKSASDLEPMKLAEDYVALMRELGVKKATIVAHSTGALIAMCAMLKAPELFHKAVFLDPVSSKGAKFEQPMYDAFTQMSQNREFCSMIMASTIQNVDTSSALFQGIVDDTFGIAKEIWHGVPNALSKIDITAELSRIRTPILILHGEVDPILPIQDSKELAENLPSAKFVELKGHGHSLNVEDPAQFVRLTDEFLFERN